MNDNDEYAEVFKKSLLLAGNKPQTIKNKMNAIRKLCESDLNLMEASQLEIMEFFSYIDGLGYSEHHRQYIRRISKAFLGFLRGSDFASFIKVRRVWSHLQKSDLISREELTELIESCLTLRDKAILSVLYDGAMRMQELVNLRLSDIELGEPLHVHLHGTKGERIIPLTFSSIYLREYLKASNRLCNDGSVFGIREAGLRQVIRRASLRSGMKKRVYAYLFRHSRITELAASISEPMLKRFAGWEQNSPMVRNYVHFNLKDLDSVIMAKM